MVSVFALSSLASPSCVTCLKEFGDEGPTADSEESNKIKHLRFSLKAFIFGCAGSLLLCRGSL